MLPVVLPDVLPDEVRREHRLCYINYAYEIVHFPDSPEALTQARRRLAFEELFLLTCGLRLLRSRREDVFGPVCRKVSMDLFYNALPFTLTDAQRRAVEDTIGDMTAGRPMNRLCQGDVGSGKTMVAAACIWFAAQSGWQSALMAPTEILARQHFETLSPLMARLGPAHRLYPFQGAAGNTGGTGRRHHRPVHWHPRLTDGGRAVRTAGAGGDGRAAPLRRQPAGGPEPEGGGSPYAGAVGHTHSPDAGVGDLR